MCTVSFVPLKKGYCITSNRDEKTARQKAIPPAKYNINNKEIYFPKDPKAGGTWFAHDGKNSIVLLNGAQEKHEVKENYTKSRGLVVIELISSMNPMNEWGLIDLKGIEPFTIVLFSGTNLFQLQWNEIQKSTIELDISKSHIWSSSTLYSKEIRKERANWFKEFIQSEEGINAEKLLKFHQFTKGENKNYGLQINRNNLLKTVSITQSEISNKGIQLNYIDLLNQ